MTNKSNNHIDDILNSLDGTERATPGPYFFTRLQQRLNKEENSIWSMIGIWISKPAVAFSALMLVILLNLTVIFTETSSPEKAEDNTDYYSMATTTNILDDETP